MSSRLLWLALLLGCGTVSGCRQAPTGPTAAEQARAALDRLLDLMQQRLALMHDVARWKWRTHKPIADPVREAELLNEVAQRGREKGLDTDFVRSFFAAQIEAAKLVQQADIERWKKNGTKPAATTEDLVSLRRKIDRLNGELIDALAVLEPLPRQVVRQELTRRAEEKLNAESAEVREKAIAPLRVEDTR